MKRPNLVNAGVAGWSPFRSVPLVPVSVTNPEPIYSAPEPSEVVQRSFTRRELIQQNSFFLNLMAFLVIASILYFLYQVYLERKVISQYLELVKDGQEQGSNGFF